MIDPKLFDQMAKRLSDAVPPMMKDVKHDVEQNFRSILQSTFGKLDLVSREEFDAQAAVLARTREKLEALEKHVEQLEAAHKPKPAKKKPPKDKEK